MTTDYKQTDFEYHLVSFGQGRGRHLGNLFLCDMVKESKSAANSICWIVVVPQKGQLHQ